MFEPREPYATLERQEPLPAGRYGDDLGNGFPLRVETFERRPGERCGIEPVREGGLVKGSNDLRFED